MCPLSLGRMMNSPSSLRQSEAILARNLFGATPAESVSCSSSRICSWIVRATSVAVSRPVLLWVTSRYASSSDRDSTRSVSMEDSPPHLLRDGPIAGKVGRNKNSLGAQALGTKGGHRRSYVELPRFIGSGTSRNGCPAKQQGSVDGAVVDDRAVRPRHKGHLCRCEQFCGYSFAKITPIPPLALL